MSANRYMPTPGSTGPRTPHDRVPVRAYLTTLPFGRLEDASTGFEPTSALQADFGASRPTSALKPISGPLRRFGRCFDASRSELDPPYRTAMRAQAHPRECCSGRLGLAWALSARAAMSLGCPGRALRGRRGQAPSGRSADSCQGRGRASPSTQCADFLADRRVEPAVSRRRPLSRRLLSH
jgi:hypothetical protein